MVTSNWSSYSITIQFNKIEGFYPSQISTSSNTPSTGNAQIVIQIEEGIISIYREPPILVRNSRGFDTQVVSHLLQLTSPIFRAGDTALSNCYIPQTHIKRLTALPTPAGKASIWMLGQNLLQDLALPLPKLRGSSVNYHILGNLCSA